MTTERDATSNREQAIRVRQAFLIFPSEPFLEKLRPYSVGASPYASAVSSAVDGLHSTITAAGLPFQLIQDSVMQRKFDRIHSSESILALIPERPGSGLTPESERMAYNSANQKMTDFLNSNSGKDFMRDKIIEEMNRRLESRDVKNAAEQLRIQTLISTWSILESFSRSFIISWINENPNSASFVLAAPELKDFFGKKAIEIKTIEDHSFDLSNSMGTIIFQNRRLDSLSVIRGVMKALFSSGEVQSALNQDIWILNQKRHFFCSQSWCS